jgi:hypothetical protein
VSCLADVASFSGLFILDCPFGFLQCLFIDLLKKCASLIWSRNCSLHEALGFRRGFKCGSCCYIFRFLCSVLLTNVCLFVLCIFLLYCLCFDLQLLMNHLQGGCHNTEVGKPTEWYYLATV